jgi:hypothetical protein
VPSVASSGHSLTAPKLVPVASSRSSGLNATAQTLQLWAKARSGRPGRWRNRRVEDYPSADQTPSSAAGADQGQSKYSKASRRANRQSR